MKKSLIAIALASLFSGISVAETAPVTAIASPSPVAASVVASGETADHITTGAEHEQTIKLPTALQTMLDAGVLKFVKTFETEAPGLTGIIVSQPNGQQIVLYGLDDYMVGGILMNGKGENLTQIYSDTLTDRPDISEIALKVVDDKHLVTEGADGAPEVYVFADPNCYYCEKFYELSRSYVEGGKVKLHWVMVGFLKENSSNISAAIMQGGAESLKLAKGKLKSAEVPTLANIPEDLRSALTAHKSYMDQLGMKGTPGFLFKSNGTWGTRFGAPDADGLESMLKAVKGE